MKHLQPCSKVFDGEIHEPHTYYHAGRDVQCLGYSPLRDPMSDNAETPEEFFGLRPITKKPSYTESSEFRNNGYDPEDDETGIAARKFGALSGQTKLYASGLLTESSEAKLLWEEEYIEFEMEHGDEAMDLFMSDWSVDRLAQKFNVSEKTVQHLIDASFWVEKKEERIEFERTHGNAATRALLWYDRLRPIHQDLILLVAVSAIFTLLSFLIHGFAS